MVGNLGKTAVVFQMTGKIAKQARADKQDQTDRGRPMNRMRKAWAMVAAAGAFALSPSIAEAAEPVTIGTHVAEPYGQHLTAQDNRAVYMFSSDRENESTCYEACAVAWPPVVSEGEPVAGEGVEADKLGTTGRKDGSTQVTYGGSPLYYYIQDDEAGKVSGQGSAGFGGAWYLVSPNGEKIQD
jgi:predicted lipoprotein with Yx(FWY)xxD motif